LRDATVFERLCKKGRKAGKNAAHASFLLVNIQFSLKKLFLQNITHRSEAEKKAFALILPHGVECLPAMTEKAMLSTSA
jgi:hypothetical protein